VICAPLRQITAKCRTPFVHVLDRFVVLARVVVGREVRILLELGIRHRNAHRVAECLEVVERQLLHLVGRIAALEARPKTVSLDGLRQDHRRLALVLTGRLEGRVNLAIVVATTLQAPEFVIRVVFDELARALVTTEEVLAHVCAVFCFVRLVVAIRSDVHQIDKRTIDIASEKFIPFAAPDDLDHVPACSAEEAFKLLDDLAVAAHRTVEPLQVAVDHEVEIVEPVIRSHLKLAAAFDLVHLTITEERPHLLVAGILDSAIREVTVELSLVDRIDRPKTHRDGRELPEIGHEPRVRIRRKAIRSVRLLLAEAIKLVGREATFEERSSVWAR
jgi:hypothetical protein